MGKYLSERILLAECMLWRYPQATYCIIKGGNIFCSRTYMPRQNAEWSWNERIRFRKVIMHFLCAPVHWKIVLSPSLLKYFPFFQVACVRSLHYPQFHVSSVSQEIRSAISFVQVCTHTYVCTWCIYPRISLDIMIWLWYLRK